MIGNWQSSGILLRSDCQSIEKPADSASESTIFTALYWEIERSSWILWLPLAWLSLDGSGWQRSPPPYPLGRKYPFLAALAVTTRSFTGYSKCTWRCSFPWGAPSWKPLAAGRHWPTTIALFCNCVCILLFKVAGFIFRLCKCNLQHQVCGYKGRAGLTSGYCGCSSSRESTAWRAPQI